MNTLWPRTAVATAAVRNLMGGDESVSKTRTPEIMADAAYAIFTSSAADCTGNFFIDDEVLSSVGVTDFSVYNVTPGMRQEDLIPDFFVP